MLPCAAAEAAIAPPASAAMRREKRPACSRVPPSSPAPASHHRGHASGLPSISPLVSRTILSLPPSSEASRQASLSPRLPGQRDCRRRRRQTRTLRDHVYEILVSHPPPLSLSLSLSRCHSVLACRMTLKRFFVGLIATSAGNCPPSPAPLRPAHQPPRRGHVNVDESDTSGRGEPAPEVEERVRKFSSKGQRTTSIPLEMREGDPRGRGARGGRAD